MNVKTNDRYRILITTDSICDLPKEILEEFPISVIPCYVVAGDGRFVDGEEMDTEELMRFLDEEKNTARSEMPSTSDYRRFFEEKLAAAERIIHISMGRYASPGYDHAKKAAEDLQGITVFDSGQVSSGMGLVVWKAAALVQQGKGHEEICREISEYAKEVSSSFIVRDLELMYRSDRISHITRDICDRLLLHPKFRMRKSRVRVGGIFAGRFKNVIRSYIRRQLGVSWKIDTEILFITHVGLSEDTLEQIKKEVEKYVHFEKIYVVEAGSTIACNCGRETLGLLFAKKEKKKQPKESKESFKEKLINLRDFHTELFAKEEFPIRQRIMNLILFIALIGGGFSGIANIFMGAYESAVTIFIMLVVAFFCLHLSIIRKRWKAAGLLICFLANMIIFPAMYFVSGGLHSGMPVWFLLGLLFDWQILTGWVCYAMFSVNLVMILGCIFLGEIHPEYIIPVTEEYMRNDIIQTVFFVVLILGAIYKYQSYVYEKQQKKIKEHEEELLRSNSAKDLFLANMSHEIRTPINGIIGMNTMLLRECGENTALEEYSRNIQTSSQTLLSLVNDILDVSKIEAGKFEITPVEYDIFSVVNDCYQIAHSRSVAKGLEFELDFNPAIPAGLYGDEMRIRQVINNLLSNAIKYTEKGTVRLSIDMEKRGDAVVDLVVSVHDTGIGIREEDKEKIFQSFLRADERRNRNIEGTGLGLNLTKNLIEMMHGKIRVDSIYGQGSTFTVYLPQQIRNRRPAGDFSKKYQENLAQKTQIVEPVHTACASALVVDDVPMNLLVAKGILRYTGIQVDTADSGKQALSLVCTRKYDIIFMDHVMPEMDGITCLHQMQELPNNQNIATPVIALTANAISGIREEYIKTGFKDYLSKPIREEELYDLLRKYLPEDKIIEQPEEIKIMEQPGDIRTGQNDTAIRLERLKQIPELDTGCGMNYCMNDESFYFDVIREYLKNEKDVVLNEAMEKEDWEQYRIYVHALKSTSLNIGAKDLSEEAKKSEMACREKDYDTVKHRHAALMQQYRGLYEKLAEIMYTH